MSKHRTSNLRLRITDDISREPIIDIRGNSKTIKKALEAVSLKYEGEE